VAALLAVSSAVRAQDDDVVTLNGEPVTTTGATGEPPDRPAENSTRIDLSVTVPSGEVNEAQARQCEDEADAGAISGEIIVCRRIGEDGTNYYSGSRSAAQKRFAEETMNAGVPPAPNVFGIPNHGNPIGFGSPPPPALIIDVQALPKAPPGSDADRISRGLPPLGQDEDLSEEEVRKRREALGLPPPAYPKPRRK
jgi:hypothetical protein